MTGKARPVAAFAVLSLVVFAALGVALAASGNVAHVAGDTASTLAAGILFVSTTAAAWRIRSGRVGLAWRLWALGAAFALVGAIAHGVLDTGPSVPSVADVCWWLFAILGVAGLILRAPPGVLSAGLFLLDALPVVLATAATVRILEGGPLGEHPSHELFLFLYAVLFAVLALVSLQMLVAHRTWNMLRVAAGFCLIAAGALVWSQQAFSAEAGFGRAALLWVPGLIVLGWAGLGRALEPGGYARFDPPDQERAIQAVPPVLAIIALVLIGPFAAERYEQLLLGLVIAAFVSFTIRFYLVRREVARSHEAVRESERRSRSMFETASTGIAVADAAGRLVEGNRALADMLGYGPEELRGLTVTDFTHPDEVGKSLELLRQLIDGARDSFELEKRYVRKDGSVVWGRLSASLVRDRLGRPELVIAMIENIDRSKRAEDKLREAETRYRTLVERLPLVTYVSALGDTSPTTYISPQIEALVGFTPADYADDPDLWSDRLLHPEDRERVLAEFARSPAEGEPFSCEYRLVASDGRVVWVLDEGAVVRDESDRPLFFQGYLLDITERRAAEEELRETTGTLRALVEASPAAIVGFDRDGKVIMWNPGAERTFGWSRDEVLGGFNPLVDEHLREEFLRFVALAVEGKSWRDVEVERRRKDGSPVHLSVSSAPLRDAEGRALGMVSILLDISRRKQAEDAIRESEERFRTLIENIPGAVYRRAADAAWTMAFMSDDIEGISGYPVSDFVDNAVRSYGSIIHPEDRPGVERAVWASLEAREPFIVEYRIVRADGASRWVYEKGQPVFGPGGELLWLDGAIFDVTERRQAEERRRAAEMKYRTLVEELPLVTYVDALDGWSSNIYTSPQVEPLLGYSPDEWQSDPGFFVSLLHPEDRERVLAEVARTNATGERFVSEYRLVARDGRTVWLRDSSVTLDDGTGQPSVCQGYLMDITDEKRAEEEREKLLETLAEQNEQLRALDRMKDEFVALVSHELRTPLTSILGYLELVLEGEAGEVSDDQRHFLSVVERNSHRLLRLVGDLLLVAQIEAGKLAIEHGEVDLASLVSECIEAARPRADERGLALTVDVAATPALSGDRVRLAQLLDNLVSNAIKFTPDGGTVTVSLERQDGSVVLSVSDSGMGIPAEEQSRLFQRFFRASGAVRNAIQGTGLGLAITKAITEAHGGTISVASEENVGTTFRVELPLGTETVLADRAA